MSIRIAVPQEHESQNDYDARRRVEDGVNRILADEPNARPVGITVETTEQGTRLFSVLIELPDRGDSR